MSPPPPRRQRKAPRPGQVTTSEVTEGQQVMLEDEATEMMLEDEAMGALLGVELRGEEMEE